jgi:hypothetical protein
MLAHAEEIDVLDDHHFVVLDREQCPIQKVIDIALVSLRHESQRLGDPFRGLEQAIAPRPFSQGEQHFRH